MKLYRLFSVAAALVLTAPGYSIAAADLQTAVSNPIPQPTAPLQAGYIIGPQDKLAIDVFHVPDLSRMVSVDTGGNIFLPLIGQVPASGRTADQLSQAIASELDKKYLKDAIVTVAVTESSSQKVTVDGA